MTTHKNNDATVSTRFSKAVVTPLGEVFITYGREEGVVISFHKSVPNASYEFIDSKEPELRISQKKRKPAKGDEVTQNGKTFEVAEVKEEGGQVYLMDDTGTWQKWEGR